jgi:hypothetical protein
MRRGEIILHVCLHGTYHRGNAGIVLHKNDIAPQGRSDDGLSRNGRLNIGCALRASIYRKGGYSDAGRS